MATRKSRDIRSGLQRKGFRECEGANHYKLILQHDGRDTSIFTPISRGNHEYDDRLLGVMASRQLRLPKADLLKLIDCPMSEAEYIAHLIEVGELHT